MTTQTQHAGPDERSELIKKLYELGALLHADEEDSLACVAEQAAALMADSKAGGEVVAWLYTLEYGDTVANTKVSLHQLNYPFGVAGADYLRENENGVSYVRQTKLYK